MSYRLKFHKKALKEWEKLDSNTREQFKKKLKQRLQNPYINKDKLRKIPKAYKIKLKDKAYRLAYIILKKEKIIIVLIIAHRDDIYKEIEKRNYKD